MSFQNKELSLWCDYSFESFKSGEFFNNFIQEFKIRLTIVRLHFTIGIGKLLEEYESFKLINEHINVLKFGWGTCVYPGDFNTHFNFSQDLSKKFLKYGKNFNPNVEKVIKRFTSIYGNFYHDLSRMEIFFVTSPCKHDCDFVQVSNTIGKITIPYKNINRLSISNIEKSLNKTNHFRVTFNFWLLFPVRIDAYQQTRETKNERDFTAWKLRRIRTFDDDLSTIQAIYESSIFYLRMEVPLNVLINLIERLSSTTKRVVEFVNWKEKSLPIKRFIGKPFDDEVLENKLFKNGSFELEYFIDALLSKGLFVKIHILTSTEQRNTFINTILDYYKENSKITLLAIENLIKTLEENVFIKDILSIFERLYKIEMENEKIVDTINYEDKLCSNYVYIKKVIITPTRILLKVPTLMVGNRVMRLFVRKGRHFLKIIFKSDDNRPIIMIKNDFLLKQVVNEYFRNGIIVGGKKHNFFGASNSQMREDSCYFVDASIIEIINMKKELGSFTLESVSKMIARVAQCFTQSWNAENAIVEGNEMKKGTEYDNPGWIKSNKKTYCYTDGCGMISLTMAKQIASSFKDKYKDISSCYQFRYGGYKGVLATYPILDKVNKLNIENKITLFDNKNQLHFIWRPSQMKFRTGNSLKNLEIVKASKPSEVSFNRPFINVLDQVSRMQSNECNRRICNRIHELYDNHVTSIIEALLDENNAFQALSSMNLKYFGIKELKDTRMFSFQTEAFFKNLVNVYASYQVNTLLNRFKIKIPSDLGRTMFGVADESGCLEYGQVFIQYNTNMNPKKDYANSSKKIHIGKVLVTKNPTVVSGDVRIFEAVDVEALHDLVDVIVFPRDGPKPHTTEIAGSDLDGDEYSVIFDENLFLEYNMEAFDFDKEDSEKHVSIGVNSHMEFHAKQKEFMLDFLLTNSVGVIATTHLIQSDFFGLESEVCNRIAIKHNTAVDFQKSGSFPKKLTDSWDKNVPPEIYCAIPDYQESDNNKTISYKSNRLLGELYSRFIKLKTLLNSSDYSSQKVRHKKNPLVYIENWEKYYDMAKKYYSKYSSTLLGLMRTYAMEDESEIFCGFRANLSVNFVRTDKDLMLDYNINIVIKQKVETLIYNIKKEILETFHPLEYYYNVESGIDETEKLRLLLECPMIRYPDEIKKFIVAAYHVTYDSSKDDMFNIFSFPWIFWDALKKVVSMNSCFKRSSEESRLKSFSDLLTEHIMKWYSLTDEEDKDLYELFKDDIEMAGCLRYMKCYKNLDILLSFLLSWSKINGLTKKIKKGMLVTLFIQCLTGYHYTANIKRHNFISKLSDLTDEELEGNFDINSYIGGLGGHCLNIFSILKSYQFRKSNEIYGWDTDIDCGYTLTCEDCININDVAERTINSIAFSHTFDILPQYEKNVNKNYSIITSYPSVSIFLPGTMECTDDEFFNLLKKQSQLDMIKYRKNLDYRGCNGTKSYLVTPIGTYESYIKFKNLIRIDQPTTFRITEGLDFTHILATKLYIRICSNLC
uniref:RNA-dependent RNA polymerase n=1 Tax=Strongyloides venezuelensis TaxID=75913 RepID=A0A0K0F1T8_STRVS